MLKCVFGYGIFLGDTIVQGTHIVYSLSKRDEKKRASLRSSFGIIRGEGVVLLWISSGSCSRRLDDVFLKKTVIGLCEDELSDSV